MESLIMVLLLVEKKENFRLKPVKLRRKLDLVLYPVYAEEFRRPGFNPRENHA